MPTTLTKMDIIKTIASSNGYSQKQAADITDTLIERIRYSHESGDDVLISGFGKFCVREKNGRMGRNPAIDKPMMLKPRRVVTFQCSGKLRDRINQTM